MFISKQTLLLAVTLPALALGGTATATGTSAQPPGKSLATWQDPEANTPDPAVIRARKGKVTSEVKRPLQVILASESSNEVPAPPSPQPPKKEGDSNNQGDLAAAEEDTDENKSSAPADEVEEIEAAPSTEPDIPQCPTLQELREARATLPAQVMHAHTRDKQENLLRSDAFRKRLDALLEEETLARDQHLAKHLTAQGKADESTEDSPSSQALPTTARA